MKGKTLRYFGRYSQAACYGECRTKFAFEKCGCRNYFMPGLDLGECSSAYVISTLPGPFSVHVIYANTTKKKTLTPIHT